MEKYRIKIDNKFYVKAVLINGCYEPHFQIMATFDKNNAGIYLKDNAEQYCKSLNEQAKDNLFSIERA